MIQAAYDFSGNDRFEIRRRIGAGGMGVVYEAYDREHKMRVALKTLPQLDAENLYRFKQEFRNLTGVVHPNLAVIYELFAVDSTWFFTMEFVEGRDLLLYILYGNDTSVDRADASPDDITSRASEFPMSERMRRGRASTPEQIERLRATLRQLAEAIDTLHAAGKLHRDIKPSNVLVTPAGRVVLLDFGLSITVHDDQDSMRVAGTVGYMSPEQSVAGRLTPASDWYAFGVLLYQALTGVLPFDGSSNEVRDSKRLRDPTPVLEIAAAAPVDLANLCRELLLRDPDRRPSGYEILERLGGAIAVLRPVRAVPLIDRIQERLALHESFDAVRSSRTLALFVHGRSGEGKSFLVQRFLDELTEPNRDRFKEDLGQGLPSTVAKGRLDRDVLILAGRCYEAESVPYKALDSLIDVLARRLANDTELATKVVPRDARALIRLFPVLEQVAPLADAPQSAGMQQSEQEIRRRATRALRDLLANIGDRVPLVLSIDDLQWGDVDSGILLANVLRGPDPPVLLFVGIYRSESAGRSAILDLLRSVGQHAGAERRDLNLSVLSQDDARVLARELLRDVPGASEATSDAIARESGGVPYFVHELVRVVRAGTEISGGITLDQVVAGRLRGLGGAARALLETIAVAGQPIRHCDAFEAAHLEGEDRGVITLLRSEHLVRSTGASENDSVEPYHDRTRETLVALMSAESRRERHRALAVTLESSGAGDAETLAVHFAAADEPQKAAPYYALAAREASNTLAFDRAANLYRESLRLRDAGDPERRELHARLADALANAGRGPEAAHEYEAAVDGASELEAMDLRRAAAYQYCVSGHIPEGRAAMRTLLGHYGIGMPESAGAIIATLLWNRLRLWFRGYEFRERPPDAIEPAVQTHIDVVWSAAAGLSMNDIIAGAGLQTLGLLLALDKGDLYRIARSMAWEATHNSNDGSKGWSKTAKLLALAQELAERSGHPHALAIATMARGIAEFTMGRWATAVPLLDGADAMFRERCTGVTWELDTAHAFALWALTYLGDFPEMSHRVALLLKEAEDRGDLYAATTFGVFHQPHALLAADDPQAARAVLESARSRWTSTGFYLQDLCALMTDALIDTYEGNGARGFERWMHDWKKVKASQLLRSQCIRALTLHFRARAALAGAIRQSSPGLLRIVEADARRLAHEGVAWCEPYARVLFAGVELIRGNRAGAETLYRESAEGFDRVNMNSHAAAARLILGELIGGEEGSRIAGEATAWMSANGIRNPRSMARMHIGAVA